MSASQSMQQTRTVLPQDGPNHLGAGAVLLGQQQHRVGANRPVGRKEKAVS